MKSTSLALADSYGPDEGAAQKFTTSRILRTRGNSTILFAFALQWTCFALMR